MKEEMEGKNLAQEQKVEAFINELKSLIKQSQEEKNSTISSNGYEVNFDEETKTYNVKFAETEILLAKEDENGFEVYPEAIDKYNKLVEQAQKNGVATLDKPAGLVESEELEEFLEKQKQEKEEQGEKEEAKSDDEREEEEKDDEKPELDKDEGEDETRTNDNSPQIQSNWIEIRTDREIDEMNTFVGAIKKEHPQIGEATRIFIAPDEKDSNSYHLVVQGKGNGYKKIPLKTTEGKNPMQEDVTVMDNDGNNGEKKQPIQMLKINNRCMIMIFNGGRTNTEVHIGNRSDGDNYTSTKISAADSQNNLKDPNEIVKNQVSSTKNAQVNNDDIEKAYAVMINLEKQDVPDEINPTKDKDGIETEELDDYPKAITQDLKKGLKELFQKNNISITDEAIEKVSEAIIDGKKFDDAVIEGMRVEESAGRIPPDSAEKAGKNVADSIKNGTNQEEERDENDEIQPRR